MLNQIWIKILEKLKLQSPQDYSYLNKSGCYVAKGIEDEDDYERVKVGSNY